MTASKKSQTLALHRDTHKQLQTLEQTYITDHSETVLSQIIRLRRKLKALKYKEAEKAIIWTKQLFYEKGDKQHTLLAKKLKDQKTTTRITTIQSPSGQLTYNPNQIGQLFHDYYHKLYNLRLSLPPHKDSEPDPLTKFLKEANLPKFTDSNLQTLNCPITTEEIVATIKSMPNAKTPGPDGLPYKYYKTYLHILLPYLTKLFNSYLQGTPIPNTTLTSYLTLLPKEGKDITLCTNYRPIALLNSDLKLFSKILANRLAPILPHMIHKDQVGFILGRQAGDNTRRVINLIEIAKNQKQQMLLLGLDAEKAFDRLSWPFLFALLQHLNLSGPYLTALNSLYSNPSTYLKLPGQIQKPISISNGTRQGCPLSPLLYALSIEPLAAVIRNNPDVTGVKVFNNQYKIFLFADDVLLTITNPLTTLPSLHKILNEYGTLSGYKINLSKTEALPVNLSSPILEILQAKFKYNWKFNFITYRGTKISSTYDKLYDYNFTPLLNQTKIALKRWLTPSLSWFGKIAALKMNILPKFLYLFETLPIPISTKTFKDIQTLFHKFIWGNKQHRIGKATLTTSIKRGGLGVPLLQKYYDAAHLRQLLAWSHWKPPTIWGHIENQMSPGGHLNSRIWSSNKPTTPTTSLLQTTRHTLNIWNNYKHKLKLKSTYPLNTIYLNNPDFAPGLQPDFYSRWQQTGQHTIKDLINNPTHSLLPFMDLTRKTPSVQLRQFEYFQLRHFLQPYIQQTKSTLPTPFESLAFLGLPQKGLISRIYKMLTDPTPEDQPKHKYMTKWANCLPTPPTTEDWEAIWTNSRKIVTCVRQKESIYKTLMFWYYTPDKLHALFPDHPNTCWRLCGEVGTPLHIFWTCPKIQPLWNNIADLLTNLTAQVLPKDPLTYLLGRPFPELSKYSQALANQVLTMTRIALAAKWKSIDPPTIAEVITRVNSNRRFEDRIAFLQNKSANFLKVWSIWEFRGLAN
uniref:Reverse transcriptase domain-containing protein n=1 Tax=Xenopus tropicalis TaxID=8364 RepID=A0A803JHE0_XENTR